MYSPQIGHDESIVKLGPALSRGVEWNRSQKEYNTYRS